MIVHIIFELVELGSVFVGETEQYLFATNAMCWCFCTLHKWVGEIDPCTFNGIILFAPVLVLVFRNLTVCSSCDEISAH